MEERMIALVIVIGWGLGVLTCLATICWTEGKIIRCDIVLAILLGPPLVVLQVFFVVVVWPFILLTDWAEKSWPWLKGPPTKTGFWAQTAFTCKSETNEKPASSSRGIP